MVLFWVTDAQPFQSRPKVTVSTMPMGVLSMNPNMQAAGNSKLEVDRHSVDHSSDDCHAHVSSYHPTPHQSIIDGVHMAITLDDLRSRKVDEAATVDRDVYSYRKPQTVRPKSSREQVKPYVQSFSDSSCSEGGGSSSRRLLSWLHRWKRMSPLTAVHDSQDVELGIQVGQNYPYSSCLHTNDVLQ